MTAGPWVLTNSTRTDIIAGNSQTGSGYSVALFTSAAGLATTVTSYASLTNEVANANGYTTGGVAVSLADTGTTSVAVYFAASPGNPTWTATGGSIVARWAVLYKIGGDVIAYCLLDATPGDVTTTSGNTLTIKSDNTSGNPIYTMA